jgi:hypothetical protein
VPVRAWKLTDAPAWNALENSPIAVDPFRMTMAQTLTGRERTISTVSVPVLNGALRVMSATIAPASDVSRCSRETICP